MKPPMGPMPLTAGPMIEDFFSARTVIKDFYIDPRYNTKVGKALNELICKYADINLKI